MVEHMQFAIRTRGPYDDLVLSGSLEPDEFGVAEKGSANSNVRVRGRDTGEVPVNGVVGAGVRQEVSIGGEVCRESGDLGER